MPKLSRMTIAILGVGIGLAALILTTTAGLRAEIRDWRSELRAESRDVRTEARVDREALRAEARANRESFRCHIIRLTEQHGLLSARIDDIHRQPDTTKDAPSAEPAG